jgi:lipoprotein signal peptidase
VRFEIIPSLLEFDPTFNDKYNYLNALLNFYLHINIPFGVLITAFLIGLIVMIVIYDYLKSIAKKTKLLNLTFILGISGSSCTLIGWLFWEKGVLDYIYLKPLCIFDLKDLYINCFVCLLLVFLHKHKKQWQSDSTRNMINHMKNYLRFIFRSKKMNS